MSLLHYDVACGDATRHIRRLDANLPQHALRPFVGRYQVRVCGLPGLEQLCASLAERQILGFECCAIVHGSLRYLRCPHMQNDPFFGVQRVFVPLNFPKSLLCPVIRAKRQRCPQSQAQRCTVTVVRSPIFHRSTPMRSSPPVDLRKEKRALSAPS